MTYTVAEAKRILAEAKAREAGEPNICSDLQEVLDWLKDGSDACERCGHEMPTKDLDAVWRLEEIIAAIRADIMAYRILGDQP